MSQMETLKSLELKSVKAYKSKDKYLLAMKEDLAEWFHDLHHEDINVENFFDVLDTGCLLCKHANTMIFHMKEHHNQQLEPLIFKKNAQVSSFQARDNISLFIHFCRRKLKIPDTLLFESEDLVSRKNERSVVLCLLEVGRKGAVFGVMVPQLVKLEQEIDEEIECEKRLKENNIKSSNPLCFSKIPSYCHIQSHYKFDLHPAKAKPAPQKNWIEVDMMTLDEMVRLILSKCTCEQQYPMIRLSEGKYTYGDNLSPIFLRVLRRHVMVRTGGGWDTLESFLGRHDPCRCNAKEHRGALAFKNAYKKIPYEEDVSKRFFKAPMETKSIPGSKSSTTETPTKMTKDNLNNSENTLNLLNDVKHLISHTKTPTRPQTVKTPNKSNNQTFKRPSDPVQSKKLINQNFNAPLSSSKSLQSSINNLNDTPNIARRKSVQVTDRSTPKTNSSLKHNTTSIEKVNNTFKTPLRPMSARSVNSNYIKRISQDKIQSMSVEKLNNKISSGSLNKIPHKFSNKAACRQNLQDTISKSLNASKENLNQIKIYKPRNVQEKGITKSKSFLSSKTNKDFSKLTKTNLGTKTTYRPMSAKPLSRLKIEEKNKKCIISSHSSQKLFSSVEDVTERQSEEGFFFKPRKEVNFNSQTKIPAPVNMYKRPSNDSLKRSDSGVDITGVHEDAESKRSSSVFSGKDFY